MHLKVVVLLLGMLSHGGALRSNSAVIEKPVAHIHTMFKFEYASFLGKENQICVIEKTNNIFP